MSGTRWLTAVLAGSLVLAGCAEGESDGADAGIDAGPAPTADAGMTALPGQDTAAADLATWDTDADARLGPEELGSWLGYRGFYDDWNTDGEPRLGVEELAAGLLEVIDASGDSSIDEAEWEEHGAVWGGEDVPFADLDADGGGSLDDPELTVALLRSPHGAAWDPSGDGTLSETEFRDAVFGAWDANGDGYLDESEWRARVDFW